MAKKKKNDHATNSLHSRITFSPYISSENYYYILGFLYIHNQKLKLLYISTEAVARYIYVHMVGKYMYKSNRMRKREIEIKTKKKETSD